MLIGYDRTSTTDQRGKRLVKVGARITLQMGDAMVPRGLFEKIIYGIVALRPLPPASC